jgi:membrane protease YdiL (CAAX protease family)
MDTARITTRRFVIAVGIVAAIESVLLIVAASEWFAGRPGFSALAATGAARITAIAALLLLFYPRPEGLAAIGLAAGRLQGGIRAGLIWSSTFGLIAGAGALALTAFGIDALALVRVGLPTETGRVIQFMVVGGLVAPIAEELFFRGVIYGYFRSRLMPAFGKTGIAWAVVVSTLLFVTAHGIRGGLPLTQIIGGFVFCIAYERSKSLAAPIIIHSLGNTALFSLSLLAR